MGLFIKTIKIKTRPFGIIHNCDIFYRTIIKKTTSQPKLAEVGRFESLKIDNKYETGQLFLHRIFGYRGIVLFPWTAKVYDRDAHPTKYELANVRGSVDKTSNTSSINTQLDNANKPQNTENHAATNPVSPTTPKTRQTSSTSSGKEVRGKVHTFYQVLIDTRDCPYIRAQTEAVTFLGNQDTNRSLYAIPGLDYVSHDDIMPYSSLEKHPLHHELFDKFLKHVPEKTPTFESKDTLTAWQEKNHPWLELSDVHKETTENIRVTVIPFYMGCRETPASSVYWWRYCIRLENLGLLTVQLRERHWRIFSLSGTLETVRGRGVVGQEPILSRRLPAFQYSSHVSLQAPSGHMWGTFRLEREDGHTFDCKIPPFSLESKPEETIPGSSGNAGEADTSKRDDSE